MEVTANLWRFERIDPAGGRKIADRSLAREVPVALEFNGIGYATLMATPADLEDLALGFALSERLIDRAGDIADVEIHPVEGGFIVRATLAAHLSDRIFERVRHRTTDSSCGLCGIENIEQVMRPLPRIASAAQPGNRKRSRRGAVRVRRHDPRGAGGCRPAQCFRQAHRGDAARGRRMG